MHVCNLLRLVAESKNDGCHKSGTDETVPLAPPRFLTSMRNKDAN